MARNYVKSKRAENQAETRQRIVEAAVDLHDEIGPVTIDDQTGTFRSRGVLVSTSSCGGLREQRKFLVRDANDDTHPPTKEQFAQARIVFQEARADDYIPEVLRLLIEDDDLYEVWKLAAEFYGKSAPVQFASEIQADLAIRHRKARTVSDFTSSIVDDYLLPGTDEVRNSRLPAQVQPCRSRGPRGKISDDREETRP